MHPLPQHAVSWPFVAELGLTVLVASVIVYLSLRGLRWYLDRPSRELSAHPDPLPSYDVPLDELTVQAEPTPEPSGLWLIGECSHCEYQLRMDADEYRCFCPSCGAKWSCVSKDRGAA